MIDIRNAKIIAFSLVAVLLLIGTVGIASVAIGSAVGYESDLPIIYDNWNPNACDTTDTSIWSLDKDTLIYEIAIWYKDWPAEKTVSYVIEKDGVEFRKGYFMKGACHHKYTYWCRGSDTPNMVFPTGTYVMKLSGSNQCQNSGSNGNGFVKLLGPPPTPIVTPSPSPTSLLPTPTQTPGFEAAFTVSGLLAMAYLVRRRGK